MAAVPIDLLQLTVLILHNSNTEAAFFWPDLQFSLRASFHQTLLTSCHVLHVPPVHGAVVRVDGAQHPAERTVS